MTQKHTQGPWGVTEHPNKRAFEGNLIVCPDDKDMVVCTIWTCDDEKETKANARLIAAAPELLEACKAVWSAIIDGDEHEHTAEQAHNLLIKAIAKAEGK